MGELQAHQHTSHQQTAQSTSVPEGTRSLGSEEDTGAQPPGIRNVGQENHQPAPHDLLENSFHSLNFHVQSEVGNSLHLAHESYVEVIDETQIQHERRKRKASSSPGVPEGTKSLWPRIPLLGVHTKKMKVLK